MGNTPSSKNGQSQAGANGPSTSAGNSQQSIAAPDGGYLIPMSGTYPAVNQEWDKQVVARLINARQLAPFYRGLQDEFELPDAEDDDTTTDDVFSEDSAQQRPDDSRRMAKITELNDLLNQVGIKEGQESVGDQGHVGMRQRESHARIRAEMEAYARGTTECPICMLLVV